MSVLKSVNPYDPARIVNYPQLSEMNLAVRIGRADTAFKKYRESDFGYRADRMNRLAALLREHSRKFAELIVGEMGKPVTEAEAEVRKSAIACDFYAGRASDFLAPREVETEAEQSRVQYEPLGPVLAVMPWNYPFWQVFRFAAPALMAGNTVLLKHASSVQGCARAIEALMLDAGFEEGVFQNLSIDASRVKDVIAHEYIRALTLTGSCEAGRDVAAIAGRNLKKCVLELGGNNAFVVLNDANLSLAVNIALAARLQNGGQSCIAAKRFIVESWIAEDFIPELLKAVAQVKMGDPMKEETQMGPLSSEKQAKELEAQVRDAVEKGAILHTGGHRRGAFFEPTVLSAVVPGMRVFDEEVFGPVFAISEANSPEAALELSNQSSYGLGMQLFTQSEEQINRFIEAAHEGAVFVNAMVRSDPRLPFGGVKDSGYGRELSIEGIREFVNIKTVWID
ncbi:MAG: succinate-semialdehyde dehydrogenase [Bacteroidetes bacterium]|nr:MAG: succinate-semialdehyde dehydrogenase [Bacteroidota bacterium]